MTYTDGQAAVAAGRWSRPGIPHKGWLCCDVEDHLEPTEVCEMCGQTDVRFLHVMTHAEHPGELRVGCVCAGKMEENYAAAQDRERQARNKASRRARLVERYRMARVFWGMPWVGWVRSERGNYWRPIHGRLLSVYGQDAGAGVTTWKWVYGDRFDRSSYATDKEAMTASFDQLFPLEKLLRWFDQNPTKPVKLPGDKGF
jgi:hypothetical protein